MSIRLGSFIEAAAAQAVDAERLSKAPSVSAKREYVFHGQKPRLVVPMATRPGLRPSSVAA